MKCPHCSDTTLVMAERQGVEIDYCPQCRGVWLDRGELDKLIERAGVQVAPAAAPVPRAAAAQPAFVDSDFHPHSGHGHKPYKKPKSWLSEIFD